MLIIEEVVNSDNYFQNNKLDIILPEILGIDSWLLGLGHLVLIFVVVVMLLLMVVSVGVFKKSWDDDICLKCCFSGDLRV